MNEAWVEAVARAICEERTWPGAWFRANEVERNAWHRDARAAIATLIPLMGELCARHAYPLSMAWSAENFGIRNPNLTGEA